MQRPLQTDLLPNFCKSNYRNFKNLLLKNTFKEVSNGLPIITSQEN